MQINLLPDNERASLQVVQLGTVLFIIGIVLIASLSFWTVYLRWQVISERDWQSGYQATVATLSKYKSETNHLQQDTRKLFELTQPLESQLDANRVEVNPAILFSRINTGIKASNVWLREIFVQKDGNTSIAGYAVDFDALARFLEILGQEPLHIATSSTRWVEQDGTQVLEFTAKVGPATGGGPR